MVRSAWIVALLFALLSRPLWAQDSEKQLLSEQMGLYQVQSQALLFRSNKKYRDALELYRKLATEAAAMKRFPGAASNTWQAIYNTNIRDLQVSGLEGMGSCLNDLGEFEQALEAYQKALGLLDPNTDYFRAATMHAGMGSVYRQMAQYEKSLRTYREAIKAARYAVPYLVQQFEILGETPEDPSKCLAYKDKFKTLWGVYMNSTAVLYALGRYEDVISTYGSAEFQQLHKWFKDPKILKRLTWAAYKMFGSEEMGRLYVAALEQLSRLADIRIENDTGACYNALADETGSVQQYEKAVGFLQKAVALAGQLPPGDQGPLVAALSNLGYAYEGLGPQNYDKAIKAHREAIEVARRLPTREPDSEIHPWLNLASLYVRSENLAAAQEAIAGAEALKEALKNLKVAWHFYSVYGRMLELKGDLAGALDRFRKAVDVVEQERAGLRTVELKQTFFRERQAPYENLIRVLQKTGRHEETLAMMERVRARAFADHIKNLDIYKGISLQAKAKERETIREQTALIVARNQAQAPGADPALATRLAAQTEKVLSEQRRTFLEIIAEAPEYASLTGGADPLKPQEIASLLDEETVLVSYFLGEKTATVAVLHPGGKSITAPLKGEPKSIRETVKEFSLLLREIDTRAWRKLSEELYGIVIGPIEKEIQGKRRLVVIPYDALNYVPFAALARPGGGPLLVESHQIVVLPSATILKFCRVKNTGRRKSAVIFALGDVRWKNFRGLPGTLVEARAIQSTLPQAQLVAEREFTLDRVINMAPNRDIIHFATHGFLDRENPMQSAIITADKPLPVADVFNLSLKANLVVLSACETGRGKLFVGDELVGLTRAFIYAGTPSILATLWPVADESTAEFMALFYKRLQEPGTDKASACQKAQLALIKKFPHPYFWAPFQLLGDWR